MPARTPLVQLAPLTCSLYSLARVIPRACINTNAFMHDVSVVLPATLSPHVRSLADEYRFSRLFVAPSESSLASKANKTGSTSPPRTGIRRLASPESRDHRTRRITRIHDALNRYSSSGNNDEGSDSADQLGAARRAGFRITPRHDQTLSSAILGLGSEVPTRPSQDATMRDALRISSRPEDRRRERIEERMQSLFGSAWRDLQRDSSYEAVGLNDNEQDVEAYVSSRGGRAARRARIV
jgi:hypothetical protein